MDTGSPRSGTHVSMAPARTQVAANARVRVLQSVMTVSMATFISMVCARVANASNLASSSTSMWVSAKMPSAK
jgi:hypothetical protein